MKKILINCLCVLAIALPWTTATYGQDVLPDRPRTQAGVPKEVIDRLNEKWEADRNPTIVVISGVQSGNQIVYSTQSTMVNRISDPLKSELRRAITDGIQVPSLQQLAEDKMLDQLKRDAGASLSDDAMKALKREYQADLLLDVKYLTSDERGRHAMSITVTDMRRGVEIASKSLLTTSRDVTVRRGNEIATAIVRSFATEYAPEDDRPRRESATYEFKLVSLSGEEGVDARTLRKITASIEDVAGVAWAESDRTNIGDQTSTVLKVRYKGRRDHLIDDIEEEVLVEYGLGWRVQGTRGQTAVAYLYPNTAPDWYRLTDPRAEGFQDQLRKRNAKLVQSGLPTLGILVGSDIDEPIAEFTADGGKKPSSFEHATLTGSLQNQFEDLGFRVVEADALRRQMKQNLGNAQRYKNLPHLSEALKELQGVDVILHVNAKQVGDLEHLNARLFDVKSGQFIGFQRWPDAASSRLAKYPVDVEEPESVARYIAGQLVSRYDRHTERGLNTFAVEVRNAEDVQQIVALSEMMRNSSPAVDSVANPQIATPTGTFDVLYKGDASSLLFAALAEIGEQYPGAEVQHNARQLTINLKPVVRSEEELELLRLKEVPLKDEGNTNSDQNEDQNSQNQTAIGSSVDQVIEALRRSKNSVWLIQVKTKDEEWTGTGWTVGKGLLATNAHVVQDIPERLARGEQVKAIAANDANQRIVLKLGRAWRHPQWNYENFFMDVGLMEVVSGDAGQPLELATEQELADLDTPVPVGYVGFPSGGTFTKGENKLPAKQAFTGHINSILSTDLNPDVNAENRMVSHNLLTSGGASGSPIINQHGKVIAVHNSGSKARAKVVTDSGQDGLSIVKSGFNGGVMVDILMDFMKSIENELPR